MNRRENRDWLTRNWDHSAPVITHILALRRLSIFIHYRVFSSLVIENIGNRQFMWLRWVRVWPRGIALLRFPREYERLMVFRWPAQPDFRSILRLQRYLLLTWLYLRNWVYLYEYNSVGLGGLSNGCVYKALRFSTVLYNNFLTLSID